MNLKVHPIMTCRPSGEILSHSFTSQILWGDRVHQVLFFFNRCFSFFYFWSARSSLGLPWWLSGKESACNAGDVSLIPGSGRSSGGGHGNPLQYSCLKISIDRSPVGWAPVHRGRKELDTPEVIQHSHMQVFLAVCGLSPDAGSRGYSLVVEHGLHRVQAQ